MVKTKKRSLKAKKIKDPKFSKKIHKGTMASKASINYEYQDYDNIIDTLELIVSESDKLMKEVKFFKKDPINAPAAIHPSIKAKSDAVPCKELFTKIGSPTIAGPIIKRLLIKVIMIIQ